MRSIYGNHHITTGRARRRNNTLFRATMKGVLRSLKSRKDSRVCASRPCMISTTRMAILHSELPRDLRFVKDSCPGVSITRRPGILYSCNPSLFKTAVFVLIASTGKYVAPICCVIPPASPSCTLVWRICGESSFHGLTKGEEKYTLSNNFVLPVST